MKKSILGLFLFIGASALYAQTITVVPADDPFFNEKTDRITLIVKDLDLDIGIDNEDVYLWAWSGSGTSVTNGDWNTDNGGTGSNEAQKMTDHGSGTYSITFAPSDFFPTDTDGIKEIWYIFKNKFGTKQTYDASFKIPGSVTETVTVDPLYFTLDDQVTITVSNLSWGSQGVYLYLWLYDEDDVAIPGDFPLNGPTPADDGWNDSNEALKLTDNGDGTYSITTPTISAFISNIGRIGFLLKNDDGTEQTSDYTIEVQPRADYTYTTSGWNPAAPTAATTTDDILIESGTAVLSGDMDIHKLTINAGATLKTQHVVKVDDYMINHGSLVFLSNATATGQLDNMKWRTIKGAGTTTVQRHIPARDAISGDPTLNGAYRFITSAVNSTGTINEDWQEGATDISANPKEHFGMFITGPVTGIGLDGTSSGEYSMFTYSVSNQQFEAVESTDNPTDKLMAGAPYLAYVWGDRSLDIVADNEVGATSTTLRAEGQLITGNATVNGLTTAAGEYNFIGNPYQAIVDMSKVLPTGASMWVWDPNLNTRGTYTLVNLADGASTPTSSANQYLMPGQAVIVEGDVLNGTSLTFQEADKVVSTTPTDVFRPEETASISVQLYNRLYFENDGPLSDAFRIEFSPGASNAVLANDIGKIFNIDENLGRMNGTELLIVEHRDMPVNGGALPLFSNNYRSTDYTFKVEVNGISELTAYLKDNYTGTKTKIPAGITNIDFSVDTSIPASIATDRFSIVFAKKPLGINGDLSKQTLSIYPNPVRNGEFSIAVQDMAGENVQLSLYNILGQRVYQAVMEVGGNDRIAVKTPQLKAGVYFVEMAHGGKTFTEKIIVQQH